MKAIARQWLDYAKADLRSCENNIHDDFLTNIVAFHAQQAVEKCFKAIIEEKDLKPERIHNLFKLFSLVRKHVSFEVNIEKLELLDNVYTSSRYPGEIGLLPFGKPSIQQATEMYDFAKYFFEKTLEKVFEPAP